MGDIGITEGKVRKTLTSLITTIAATEDEIFLKHTFYFSMIADPLRAPHARRPGHEQRKRRLADITQFPCIRWTWAATAGQYLHAEQLRVAAVVYGHCYCPVHEEWRRR